MNAISHAKFTVSLADLIKAEADYFTSCIEAERRGEPEAESGSPVHDTIMSYRCRTLAEVRAKLHWMTCEGAGLEGEDDAFQLMLEDLDRLIAAA